MLLSLMKVKSRYLPEGNEYIRKNISKNIRPPGQDSNPGSVKYEARTLNNTPRL
jgi:hypothetical protein